MRASEAAAYMGIGVNTLKRIPENALAFYRINSRGDRRYKLADIQAYIAENWEQA
jgi:excisionase family DNA binding protein